MVKNLDIAMEEIIHVASRNGSEMLSTDSCNLSIELGNGGFLRKIESFATLWTFESLISCARVVVLMGFQMVVVGTLHESAPDSHDS